MNTLNRLGYTKVADRKPVYYAGRSHRWAWSVFFILLFAFFTIALICAGTMAL